MPELRGWKLSVVDVAALEGGVDTYGARIPVLTSGGQELAGPLNTERIRDWLRQLPSGD